jgi:5-methylthioadenosine/S-adenosylhomocysteine deaminase
MRELGDREWVAGMHPDVPETQVYENPYQYTEYKGRAGA